MCVEISLLFIASNPFKEPHIILHLTSTLAAGGASVLAAHGKAPVVAEATVAAEKGGAGRDEGV